MHGQKNIKKTPVKFNNNSLFPILSLLNFRTLQIASVPFVLN